MADQDQRRQNGEVLQVPIDPRSEAFFAGAFGRITRMMAIFAVAGVAAVWIRWGTAIALGLAAGCLIAFVNFVWLKRIVAAMAGRIVRAEASGEKASLRGLVVRYLLRYLFIAAAAYVIFRSSPISIYGLLAGLFLPVPAIFCEAAYEWMVSLRRGY